MINIQDIVSFMKDGWVAMDGDGEWYWYEKKPLKNKDFYQWVHSKGVVGDLCAFDIAPADDWTKSLIKVDHISQEGKKVGGK